jgi:hypothetical protein
MKLCCRHLRTVLAGHFVFGNASEADADEDVLKRGVCVLWRA